MIRKFRLSDESSSLYAEFKKLYELSFPLFEQRTSHQQSLAFNSLEYHLEIYTDCNILIGFISYWEFDSNIYIEHLAVNQNQRGKGYGTKIITNFINRNSKIIILEIDPIVDDISKARLRFYKHCGFYKNGYTHVHPPYRKENKPHSLIILSSKRELTFDEYDNFNSNLNNIVMRFDSL